LGCFLLITRKEQENGGIRTSRFSLLKNLVEALVRQKSVLPSGCAGSATGRITGLDVLELTSFGGRRFLIIGASAKSRHI
jgi:hypothetical protein